MLFRPVRRCVVVRSDESSRWIRLPPIQGLFVLSGNLRGDAMENVFVLWRLLLTQLCEQIYTSILYTFHRWLIDLLLDHIFHCLSLIEWSLIDQAGLRLFWWGQQVTWRARTKFCHVCMWRCRPSKAHLSWDVSRISIHTKHLATGGPIGLTTT